MLNSLIGKSLLITGGTGPFGHAILNYLNELDIDLEVNLISRNKQSVDYIINKYSKLTINGIVLDLLKVGKNEIKELPRCSHVLHMASVTAHESFSHISPYTKYNLLQHGTSLIYDYCIINNVEKLVFTSSGAVYGKYVGCTPILEAEKCRLMTDDTSKYGLIIGKISSEFIVASLSEEHDIPVTIARCFGICGPYLPLDIHYALGNFTRQALLNEQIDIHSDGLDIRSYMDTRDLAKWLLYFLGNNCIYKIYNVGSNEVVSIRELADKTAKVLASNSKVCVNENARTRLSNPTVKYYVPDINRAREEGLGLDYKLDESLSHYAKWARTKI